MLYEYNELSNEAKIRALDDLWHSLADDPDWNNWFQEQVFSCLKPLRTYLFDFNGSSVNLNETGFLYADFPWPGTFAYEEDGRVGWAFERYPFSAYANFDRWVDPSSVEAYEAKVPPDDIEWTVYWPVVSDIPFLNEFIELDVEEYVEEGIEDFDRLLLDADSVYFRDDAEAIFSRVLIPIVELFFWDHCEDLYLDTVVPRLEGMLTDEGRVFFEDGTR